MNIHQAKKDAAARLAEHKLQYQKLTAKSVSFQDLARADAIFVTIHFATKEDCYAAHRDGKFFAFQTVPKPSDGGYIAKPTFSGCLFH